MSKLREMAMQVSMGADGSDDFADALVETAPEVNKFLASCGNCKEPCPPNPNTSATADEKKAWQDAHNLKTFAGQATEHHKKEMAHHIKKSHRKNKDPISEQEAVKLATTLVNTAKNSSLEDTSAALLDSRTK